MDLLSVVIITFNEEQNIGRCIQSVQQVADEVVVLDSFSEDKTVEIAMQMGARVQQSAFTGYISQKNRAIGEAANDFVLLLDADEFLSDELAASILKEKAHFAFSAYTMKRCNIFRGSHIKHGLWYPDRKLRLFDKRLGSCGGLNPHDRVIMKDAVKVRLLKGDLYHHTFSSVEEYRRRNAEVSTIVARSMFDASIKRPWIRMLLSPLWTFINGYILRFGFVEGYNGWLIALLSTQQSFLKYYKLRQLQRQQVSEIAWE